LLGKWLGKLVPILVFVFFLAAFGPIMITFVYHLQEYFLPEAPIYLFIVAALVVSALGCYYGLEVMARMALVGLFFILLLNVLIVLGSFEELDIRNLLPVLEYGMPKTLLASLHYDTDWALATLSTALILPMVKDTKKQGLRAGVIGILATGLLVIIWPILEGAVLSSEVTSQYTVACMKLARNAHIGDFLQRYEMVMIAFFSISSLIQVMMCLYGSSLAAAKLLGLQNVRYTIAPVAIVLGLFGNWVVMDHFRAIRFLEYQWPWIALPIAVGLPLLLLVLRLLLRRRIMTK